MRTRIVLSAVCLSLVCTGIGVVAVPPAVLAATGVSVQEDSPDKIFVQYLARRDPRSTVRIGAWQALLSSAPDAAIAQFLDTGYDYAVNLAAQRKTRNADFAKRVLATFTAEFSPEVHAAAQYAVNSRDDADRERFANGGFAAARQRDSAFRVAQGQQAQALVEADRAFVRQLAVNDPGAQVRVSASYAVRAGATDADIVDFYASGWAFGARLDLETFRQTAADNDMRWRATLTRLIVEAQAAEKAAQDASEEAKEQAKAAAVRAWQAVGKQTEPGRSSWSDAQDFTARQASTWAAIAEAARVATGPNWAAMVDPATANQSDWDGERAFAADQAKYWNAMLQQALDGEQRVAR
ncbi:hypothetical protein AB5J62_39230 [Amycolatopsis sp. cg5]|uniref:hypothetical protein n=1 Tax=Amycolatopsis sp. cg5 TaxID=3238802 RepID=UPI0035244625